MSSLPGGNTEDIPTPGAVLHDPKTEYDIAQANDDEESSFPEGGLKAWLVVVGSFSGM